MAFGIVVLVLGSVHAATPKPAPPPLELPAVTDFKQIAPVGRSGRPLPLRPLPTPARNIAPTLPDLSKLIPPAAASADGSVTATEAGVEFAGFLGNGREHRFVLTAPLRGSSEWLALGQTYAGVTLVEFDSALEVLAVRTGDRTLRLALKDGRPRAASPAREATIMVDAQGQLFVAGEKTPSADLRGRLESLAQNLPNLSFHLVVVWPRSADGGLVERLGNHIAETVRSLPPELQKRYPALSWKTEER